MHGGPKVEHVLMPADQSTQKSPVFEGEEKAFHSFTKLGTLYM